MSDTELVTAADPEPGRTVSRGVAGDAGEPVGEPAGDPAATPSAFRRLWISTASANLADGILWLVIPVIAVEQGAGATELALITVAERGPMLLLGLVAGGLADRHDRRRTMLAVQYLRIVTAFALLAVLASGTLGMPALVLAALLFGIGEVFFDTNAQAFVAAVVPAGRLVAANGRIEAATRVMNTFVGPPLGGWLLAVSASLAVGVAAGALVVAATALLAIRGSFRPEAPARRSSMAGEIRNGLAFLGRHRLLRTLSLMTALQHLALGAAFTVMPLQALSPGPLALSPAGFGLLLSAWGVGSVLAALVADRLVQWAGRPGVLIGSTVVAGLALLASAASSVPLVFAAYVVAGAALTAWGTVNASVRQALTPDALRGRVNATHRTLSFTAGVAGAAMAAIIAGVSSPAVVIVVGGLAVLAGLFGAPTISLRLAAAATQEPGGQSARR